MDIFKILSRNFGAGSRTLAPDDVVDYPTGFRGVLRHQADLCTACGTCAYTCSPSAIVPDRSDKRFVVWRYFEDHCTFCGLCVDYCPTGALSFEAHAPEVVQDRTQHYISHTIEMETCPQCGRLFKPIPPVVLERLYTQPPAEEVVNMARICDECRRQATSLRFKQAISGEPHNDTY